MTDAPKMLTADQRSAGGGKRDEEEAGEGGERVNSVSQARKRCDPAAVSRWKDDRLRRSRDGKRLWRCSYCDTLSPWTSSHGCYTSWAIMEEGDVPYPIWCSDGCRRGLVARGDIPAKMEALET